MRETILILLKRSKRELFYYDYHNNYYNFKNGLKVTKLTFETLSTALYTKLKNDLNWASSTSRKC